MIIHKEKENFIMNRFEYIKTRQPAHISMLFQLSKTEIYGKKIADERVAE
ncbi:hypothetical protein MTsPCn5_37860 [Croceitalea sp. MTPC5]|nr:hypothetical protein MTsPCn5_37860 [Croceitalea sp. MTPC5]